MASIISTRKQGEKIISEVLSDYEEFLQLKGHLKDIRMVTENIAEIQTNISQRGKNAATKYFLIPKQFRKGFRFNNTTSCQRLDLKDKVMFIYIVDKMKINQSKREMAIEKMEKSYQFADNFALRNA